MPPQLSSKQLENVLKKAGFVHCRTNGSHATYSKTLASGRVIVTTLVLGRKDLPKGTISGILRQAEISAADLEKLL